MVKIKKKNHNLSNDTFDIIYEKKSPIYPKPIFVNVTVFVMDDWHGESTKLLLNIIY